MANTSAWHVPNGHQTTLYQEPATPGGDPILAPNVVSQLVALAPGGGPGGGEAAAGAGFVEVDVWLEWLLGSYADSKRNAATLFEALYDRCAASRVCGLQ